MTSEAKRPNLQSKSNHSSQTKQVGNIPNRQKQSDANADSQKSDDIVTIMVNKIESFTTGLREYKIRELVEHTEKLGKKLADKGLKTTQIRKFLDAVNRLKFKQSANNKLSEESIDELQVLRYKLAYVAARQQKGKDPGPVEPLKQVLEAALKQVMELEDFKRLVQLIESIVAYHKAAGGKEQ